MNTDENFPGSDIIFFNTNTGEIMEVLLKAVFYKKYYQACIRC